MYTLGTSFEENDQGSWYGWNILGSNQVTDPTLYLAARKFHDDVTKNEVKLAQPAAEAVTEDLPVDTSDESF